MQETWRFQVLQEKDPWSMDWDTDDRSMPFVFLLDSFNITLIYVVLLPVDCP